jgi:Fe2+ or Zn2+ uptake regulation protein
MTEQRKQAKDTVACLAGRRLTTQRILLLNLLSEGEHLSAGELFQRVKKKDSHFSISSVYRSLQLFVKLKLVEENHFYGACPAMN